MRTAPLALATLAAAALAGGCSVTFPVQGTYTCASSSDCGPASDGFLCVAGASGPAYCCKSTPEACDGLDNDCNGKVDDLPPQTCYSGPADTAGKGICKEGSQYCQSGKWGDCFEEVVPVAEFCNALDDDCDGQTDETFDFRNDDLHCGNCGTACIKGQWCANGKCSKDTENCADAIDNDRDGKTDCADDNCTGQLCKASPSAFTCDALFQCSCEGVSTPAAETACDDYADNDCDGAIDCADGDCDAKACGLGCTCRSLQMTEIVCDNGRDDDQDTKFDCDDADCAGKSCGAGCACAGAKAAETDCTDGVDNDGDRLRDCIDPDCAGKACTRAGDGGIVGGTCQSNVCT